MIQEQGESLRRTSSEPSSVFVKQLALNTQVAAPRRAPKPLRRASNRDHEVEDEVSMAEKVLQERGGGEGTLQLTKFA